METKTKCFNFRLFYEMYQRDYEDFTGEPIDNGYGLFSIETQIDRHTQALTFWFMKLHKTLKTKGKSNNHIIFIKYNINLLMTKIENTFPKFAVDNIKEGVNKTLKRNISMEN